MEEKQGFYTFLKRCLKKGNRYCHRIISLSIVKNSSISDGKIGQGRNFNQISHWGKRISATGGTWMKCHEVDYKIIGNDMQVVEVELDPSESVVAEAGAMNYMDDDITFEAKMGDSSRAGEGMLDGDNR
jgi:Mitochondrial biogenesis AIM24